MQVYFSQKFSPFWNKYLSTFKVSAARPYPNFQSLSDTSLPKLNLSNPRGLGLCNFIKAKKSSSHIALDNFFITDLKKKLMKKHFGDEILKSRHLIWFWRKKQGSLLGLLILIRFLFLFCSIYFRKQRHLNFAKKKKAKICNFCVAFGILLRTFLGLNINIEFEGLFRIM